MNKATSARRSKHRDKIDSLVSVFRAHLDARGLRLVGADGPLDAISEQFALRELGEVSLDLVRFAPEEEITREIPLQVLENLIAAARVV